VTCQFCHDRPLVMATGRDGELIAANCPVCGIAATPGPGTAPNNDLAHGDSMAEAADNAMNIRALNLGLP
jgi:hypothetical protein